MTEADTETNTRITTTADGTRYRITNNEHGSSEMEPLPRVPGWPLPGPAPQYLADIDAEVHLKDTWVIKRSRYGVSWTVVTHTPPGGTMRERSNYREAWLISRDDPEADA